MKAQTVKYERLINKGNYSHEVIGITILVEDGERADDVIAKAKQFVDKHDTTNHVNRDSYFQRVEMNRIVENPDDFAPKKVREAKEWLENNSQDSGDLPF